MNTDHMIENIHIEHDNSNHYIKFLYRPLPEAILYIEVILRQYGTNTIHDQGSIFSTPNYISNDKSVNDNNILDLITRGNLSGVKSGAKELSPYLRISDHKVIHTMKRLGSASYNALPDKHYACGLVQTYAFYQYS